MPFTRYPVDILANFYAFYPLPATRYPVGILANFYALTTFLPKRMLTSMEVPTNGKCENLFLLRQAVPQ